MSRASLQVQVLGPLAVYRGPNEVRLPQSKKTRGLLAYLAITGRSHRRDRLCGLLWDVADDPRGALRWSLSKIRPVVDSEASRCLVADRESVELLLDDTCLDWRVVRRELANGVDQIPSTRLEELASVFRGELLEGLDMLDFDEFTAWCAAEREHARLSHAKILSTLVSRYRGEPSDALPHARELVRIDPLNQEARADLIQLLALAGRRPEALAQYESAKRLIEELGANTGGPLEEAWRHLSTHVDTGRPTPSRSVPVEVETRPPEASRPRELLIGRADERKRLSCILDRAQSESALQVFLLKGESGVGKTTLLSRLRNEAEQRGSAMLEGAAYEAEAGRPYGPWIDALRRLPPGAISAEDGRALAPLLPELGHVDDQEPSRDRLFGAVVAVIEHMASPKAPTLLLFDDIHWSDDATTELLHYIARANRDRRLAIVLGARDGELVDNESAMKMLRSFRREGWMAEHLLLPLSEGDIADLVREIGSGADATQVFTQSGGNPLLARELATAAAGPGDALPASVKELVTDRITRLPVETADVLRWAAVLGPNFPVGRLVELTSLDFDPLMNALSTLERHTLLESNPTSPSEYAFSHALVHRVVYSEISEPRRKLMHLRVATLLQGRTDPSGEVAIEIAHHAGVGGDPVAAAKACVIAGTRCLKIFANTEALALARRGFRYAEGLPAPESLKLRIELEQISTAAKVPDDIEGEVRRIEALAEEALAAGCPEHARLGFTVVSYLRWNMGEASDAHRLSLRAEFASRGADEIHRIVGMAEAARCMVILERDVPKAEVLLHQARTLTEQAGKSPWPVIDGVGLLELHGGDLDGAKASFEKAWTVAKKIGNRIQEFMALEHLVMVSIERGEQATACEYAQELSIIGEKLREGSERPLGQTMLALCQYSKGVDGGREALEEALEKLREVDAKQRLSFVLTRAAQVEARNGDHDIAQARGEESLRLAELMQHPSAIAEAKTVLLHVAVTRGDAEAARKVAATLANLDEVSQPAREAAERQLEAAAPLVESAGKV